jgi:F-type H+-transporting ATPase subunit epsilon
MQCIVVTPEAPVVDEAADFVALTLFDGEIGVAPDHTPLIGRLGYGEMRITDAGKTERYYIEGGFVEVVGNVVTVLTNRAVPAEQIDEAVVEEQLRSAQARPARTPESMAVRDRAVEQCRAQLRVARRAE